MYAFLYVVFGDKQSTDAMSSVQFLLRRKLSSMASVPCSVFEGTQFDGGVGERAGRVGVVTLSTDQTIGTL